MRAAGSVRTSELLEEEEARLAGHGIGRRRRLGFFAVSGRVIGGAVTRID